MRKLLLLFCLCISFLSYSQNISESKTATETELQYKVVTEMTTKVVNYDTLTRVGIIFVSDNVNLVDIGISLNSDSLSTTYKRSNLLTKSLSASEVSDAKKKGIIWLGEFDLSLGMPDFQLVNTDKVGKKSKMKRIY